MITDKEFLAFINDNSLDCLTKEKLSKIIDEELEKTEAEMDTELMEYCIDKIDELDNITTKEKKGTGDTNGKRINIRLKRIIVIAAIVTVFLSGTLSVSASVFDVNIFDGIVERYKDHIRINFDKIDDTTDNYELLGTELSKELVNKGFDTVLLPEVFFSDNYRITKIEYEFTETLNGATIIFEKENKVGSINISKYTVEEIVPDVEFLDVTSDIEKIEIGNITAYCFMQNDCAAITYRDGLSIYYIQVPQNLDDALEIAKTIK